MFIEGKNATREALENDTTINKLMVDKNYEGRKDEIIGLAHQKNIKVEYLPKSVLDKKSKTLHHQGYIAESVEFEYSTVQDILNKAKDKNENPFVILLDGIEDPHNFGAIIRSCECAGVHGIIIPKNRACQVNETVVKTSTGAISNMLIAKVTNLKEAVDFLKDNDVWVFVSETGGQSIYKQKLNGNIGIVIGSEGNGVKQSLRTYCDGVVSLPLLGSINSLNASVACGIVAFEVVRQRQKGESINKI